MNEENNIKDENTFNEDMQQKVVNQNAEQNSTEVPQPVQESTYSANQGMSSISDLFNKSLELYKASFWKMIGMVLLPLIGLVAIAAVGFLFFGIKITTSSMAGGAMGSLAYLSFGIVGILAVVGMFYLSLVSKAGLLVLIRDSQKNITFKQGFSGGQKHALGVFFITWVTGIFVLFWALLFIIPGLFAAVYYSLAVWAYIYEGHTGIKALDRSKELVKDYWLAVFTRYAAVFGGFYLFIIILSAGAEGDGVVPVILTILIQVLSILVAPLFMSYSCFIYWDLRKIKDKAQVG